MSCSYGNPGFDVMNAGGFLGLVANQLPKHATGVDIELMREQVLGALGNDDSLSELQKLCKLPQ